MAHSSIGALLLLQLVMPTTCVHVLAGLNAHGNAETQGDYEEDDYRPSGPSMPLYPVGMTPGVMFRHPRRTETWTPVDTEDPVHKKCGLVDAKGASKARWLFNVTEPSLTPYVVSKDNPRRVDVTAVIVPGGGLRFLAMDSEGSDYAAWLNSIGISAFVLKYRVPSNVDYRPSDFQVMDVQRALNLVRHKAPQYGLSPFRVGIVGSSAGGALAIFGSVLGGRAYRAVDEADLFPRRADFALLLYPQVPSLLTDKPLGTKVELKQPSEISGSAVNLEHSPPSADVKLEHEDLVRIPEVGILPDAGIDPQAPILKGLASLLKGRWEHTPPTFIAVAENDPCTPSDMAMAYYEMLKSHNGRPSELHVFPNGGHGYGRCSTWPNMKWYEVCTWTRNAEMFFHSSILQEPSGSLPKDWEGPFNIEKR